MNKYYVKQLVNFILYVALFLFSNNAFPTIFIDISKVGIEQDEVKIETKQEVIRVCVFDTELQKYINISYFVIDTDDDFTITFKGDLKGLEITSDGSVSISENTELKGKDYIVRTYDDKKITISSKNVSNPYRSIPLGEALKSERVLQKLKNFADKKHLQEKGKVTVERWYSSKDKSEEINFNNLALKDGKEDEKIWQNRNSKERGIIGELATEYTMLSFGYKRFDSKYGHNHGNDGIFTSSGNLRATNIEIFITESKARNESKSAEDYMEEFESKIQQRINLTPGDIGSTVKLLRYNHPESIFAFVHRIKEDGFCECYLKSFVDIQTKYIDIVGRDPICVSIGKFDSVDDLFCTIFSQLSLNEFEKIRMQCSISNPNYGDFINEFKLVKNKLKQVDQPILPKIKTENNVEIVDDRIEESGEFPGWRFYNPLGDGNCFFDAVYDQLFLMSHPFIQFIDSGRSTETLRANIQGLGFALSREWADEEDIIRLISGFDVDVAVYYINDENSWYRQYNHYRVVNGVVLRNTVPTLLPVQGRITVILAYDGVHYRSVRSRRDVINEVPSASRSSFSAAAIIKAERQSATTSSSNTSTLIKPNESISVTIPSVVIPETPRIITHLPVFSSLGTINIGGFLKHPPEKSQNPKEILDKLEASKANLLSKEGNLEKIYDRGSRRENAKKHFELAKQDFATFMGCLEIANNNEIQTITNLIDQIIEQLDKLISISSNTTLMKTKGTPEKLDSALTEIERKLEIIRTINKRLTSSKENLKL